MSNTAPAQPQASQAPFQIGVNVQYIKDFSFESPGAPQIFAPSQSAPTLDMGVNVTTRAVGENAYEVLLQLKLEAKLDGKVAFIAELQYGGVLSIPPLPEEHLKFILLVEGPRLLFPFARSILANAVRDGGFPQILIAPIDFAGMYQSSTQAINAPSAGTA